MASGDITRIAHTQFDKMTPEQRRECGRKGGIKSGEAKRRKKEMKEALGILLGMKLKPGKGADIEAIKDFASIKGQNITVQDALLVAQIQKAMKGDTQALTFLRDTSGQKPDENVNLTGAIPVVISGENELQD